MYLPENVAFSGKLGPITITRGGRLFSCYTEGPGFNRALEPGIKQQILGRWSDDQGENWSSPQLLLKCSPSPGRVVNPLPLATQDDKLHIFFLRYYKFDWKTKHPEKSRCELWHTISENEGHNWSKPEQIDFGHTYTGALNSAIELDNGRILVPLSYLSKRAIGKFVSTVVFSDDSGNTWQRCRNDLAVASGGDAPESGAIEPVVVQLGNKKVWMVIRTQTGFLYESFSDDNGISWQKPHPTKFVSSNSPAGLLRLTDGRIVIAWNNCYDYKPISYARESLHVAISNDNGKHWKGPKEVVRRPGNIGQVSYPFLCESSKNHLLMIYHQVGTVKNENWNNPTIGLMRIDPVWIEGKE